MDSARLLRLRAWSERYPGLVLVTLAALALRLYWNLKVHRPVDFAFSDMKAYLARADAMLDHLPARPSDALFPYGTHYFVYAVGRAFGRGDDALGAAYAMVGALAVAYTYATAARFCTRASARRSAGLLLVLYYPWISLSGYVLSEAPFTLCLAGTAFHGLCLADRGRARDAWLLGLFLGLGAAVRPQILLAVPFLLAHVALRRHAWRSFRRSHVARAAAPLLVVLAFSAARLHQHTGAWGLVSANGPLNAVFGRCHNVVLHAQAADGDDGYFGSTSFERLRERERLGKRPLFTLNPALGDELTIEGHLWDAEPSRELAERCVARTGTVRQVKYALEHVALLWAYNVVWPDQSSARWHLPMEIAGALHVRFLLPPAALGLLLALRRRRARSLLLALHVYALLLVAMAYFGDARFRVPYDGLIIVLAMETYAGVAAFFQVALSTRRTARR